MAYGLSNGHVTDDVTYPQRCREAVRLAILATAWLLVVFAYSCSPITGRANCQLFITSCKLNIITSSFVGGALTQKSLLWAGKACKLVSTKKLVLRIYEKVKATEADKNPK